MAITGRAVALVALGVIPALLMPHALTVLTWAVLVAVISMLDWALAGSLDALQIRRTPMAAVRLTEETSSELMLTNAGQRTLRALVRDAWQPSAGAQANRHRVHLPAGESRRISTTLRPTRRGELTAGGVTVRSFGPLGLLARQRTIPDTEPLLVLPEFASRRHLPSRLARLREMDGRTAVNVRGQGTEFDSLREYVIGDDVRAIDWRATARRAEVVVRTWRPERDRRVLIMLDTSRLSAARLGDVPRLDAGIESALLLTALAAQAGDRVDLIAAGRTVQARVRGEQGPAMMAQLARSLASLEPELLEPDWPLVAQEVRDRMSQRGLVVLLTALEPGAVESGLVQVVASLSTEHQVVLASATDPEAQALRTARDSSIELFDAAAAERTELERAALAQRLRQAGAQIIQRGPHDLAPGLADTYLALKAAGRL